MTEAIAQTIAEKAAEDIVFTAGEAIGESPSSYHESAVTAMLYAALMSDADLEETAETIVVYLNNELASRVGEHALLETDDATESVLAQIERARQHEEQ